MPFTLSVAAALSSGKVRKTNEDNYYRSDYDSAVNCDAGRLFLTVDGVGGNKGGAYASLIACEKLPAHFFSPSLQKMGLAQRLREAISLTHEDIVIAARENSIFREMSCTLVAVGFTETEAAIASMGDSRIYRLRNEKLKQLTVDHSMVQEQVLLGILTPDQARNHPNRNVVTRSLGGLEKDEPDIRPLVLQVGDRLVLCSDGLHGPVPPERLATLMGQRKNQGQIVRDLIEEANAFGGPDNIVALSIQVVATKDDAGITEPMMTIQEDEHLRPIGLIGAKVPKPSRFWRIFPWS